MSIEVDRDVIKSLPAQEEFARDIEKYWRCELRQDIRTIRHKGGDFNPIDYMLIEPKTDKVLGYIELKNRSFESTKYNSLIIDHQKMVEIRKKHLFSSLPVFLGVRYTDVDLYYKNEPNHFFPIYHKGRTKLKRNEYDIKEVEYIPSEYFKRFK
jgi:hypothetical protein